MCSRFWEKQWETVTWFLGFYDIYYQVEHSGKRTALYWPMWTILLKVPHLLSSGKYVHVLFLCVILDAHGDMNSHFNEAVSSVSWLLRQKGLNEWMKVIWCLIGMSPFPLGEEFVDCRWRRRLLLNENLSPLILMKKLSNWISAFTIFSKVIQRDTWTN